MLPCFLLGLFPLAQDGSASSTAFALSKPPADITRLLARLQSNERLSKEDAEAARRDCFRPYFPLLVLSDVGLKEGTARTVFVDFYLGRHKERRDGWVKAGRLDLLAESMVVAARGDPALADRFAKEWAVILADLIGEKAHALVKAKVPANDEARQEDIANRFKVLDEYLVRPLGYTLKRGKYNHEVAAPVVSFGRYKPGTTPDKVLDVQPVSMHVATFADRLELTHGDRSGSIHLVAGDVWIDRSPEQREGVGQKYIDELFVANGSVECGQLETSVVIADGDVTLNPWGINVTSLVIARGDIRVFPDKHFGQLWTRNCLFVAGGKITGTKVGGKVGMLFAAGGVELTNEKQTKKPDPGREKGIILDGIGPKDLGVRWFESSDVGLEVVADGKTAVVKAVAEKSPFRNHLQPKDVLKEINTTPITTPDAVRRALRRAYILGFAVVTFERDGKVASRLIPIDDLMSDTTEKK